MTHSILEESRRAKMGWWTKIFKKRFLVAILVVGGVASASYYYYTQKNQSQAMVTTKKQAIVQKEDLRIAVEASGKVVAKDGVELSFPVSGNLEVSQVYVKEGDKVQKGDKIAAVKTETLEFELRNAYASYQSALASFNAKKAAPTQSELDKAKATIDQAQISLDQAKISLDKTKSSVSQQIKNAEITLETATNNLKLVQDTGDSEIVRDAYLSLANTIKSINISLQRYLSDSDSIIDFDNQGINDDFENVLGAKDVSSLTASKNSYLNTRTLKINLESLVNNLDSQNYLAIDAATLATEQVLNALQSHLYDMQKLVEATITSINLSQSELDSFRSTINSNRSGVNSAINTLNSSVQAVRTAKSNLNSYQIAYDKAVNDLQVTKSQGEQDINTSNISVQSREIALRQAKIDYDDLIAPISATDLATAQAQLTSAVINVDKAKYNMEQATLTSPIEGVISMLNYKQGDIILSDSAKSMATIINNDTLFIEVNIEEADIGKLKVGQKAVATFEAVDGSKFEGDISFISLTSETTTNGIVTYLVRVALAKTGESQIREGMTAAVEFIISEAAGVLSVPVAAVRNIGGKPSVVLANNQVANVVTGFTDGKKVEIISGLKEGDVVVY